MTDSVLLGSARCTFAARLLLRLVVPLVRNVVQHLGVLGPAAAGVPTRRDHCRSQAPEALH